MYSDESIIGFEVEPILLKTHTTNGGKKINMQNASKKNLKD